ncbi:HesA/MoeB/ThiF family protein [Phocaeicola coprocola]|uniref:HesA/MoeB/ThiF family protein n=1 Tax=Phocaeicola coprocola TaxID=310298 RepID=UPI003994ACD1
MQLTEKEKERYNRQIQLDEIGEKGQTLLRQAKVLIVGVGGLGSPIAIYLCGAGVGTIGLVDDDKVSETNLQRQILYNETEVGKPKVLCAKERLQKLNSNICIEAYPTRLTKENAQEIISRYDIVVDGCDNFQTRYLINDTCLLLNKVYVYGAIRAFDGQVSVFNYQGGKNYRDLFPDEEEMLSMPAPPKGVLGVTPGLIGCTQTNEVLKIISGYGEVLSDKLWHIDLKTMVTHTILL